MENMQEHVAVNSGVKKAAVVALSLLSLFLLAASIGQFKKIPTIGRDMPAMNTINVSGTCEGVAGPDIATFSFSVTEESLNVAEAQSKSAKSVNDIMAFLAKNGVDKKDIKTSGYNIYPRYDYLNTSIYYPGGRQSLVAYVVSQSVEVKVRKIADAGKLLGGLGELGANNVSGISFGFDNDDNLKADARDKAIQEAKTRAKTIANSLGVSLGRIVSFSENGNYPYPIAYGKGGADMMVSAQTVTPEISAGESKIISTVNITYEIR